MPLAASTTPLNVPTVVGVPEIRPAELNVRPLGSVPEASVNDGLGVPVAVYWNEYPVATVAGVVAAVVPVNAGTWSTTMVKLSVAALPMPLTASTTPLNVPAVVGVPEIRPAELSVRPLGSVPEVRLNDGLGTPVAVYWNE